MWEGWFLPTLAQKWGCEQRDLRLCGAEGGGTDCVLFSSVSLFAKDREKGLQYLLGLGMGSLLGLS